MRRRLAVPVSALVAVLSLLLVVAAVRAQRAREELEPFVGVTTDGEPLSGLFPIRATGVSTAPIVDAARTFLDSLDAEQRAAATFPVDSDEWRLWHNVHRYERQGVSREDMTAAQERAALDLLRATLSADGFGKARDIMRLNGVLAELTGKPDEYGEGLYWFTVMGEPSSTEPWGFQLDGHHLVINTFVLGDQVVMTPTFMGSEPTHADSGPYAGTRVFAPEERVGLALVQSLSEEQRDRAVLGDELPRNVFTAGFRDNFEMSYQGLRADELDAGQRDLLLDLVREYVGNLREGHAGVKMAEVEAHLDDTWFAWMGATDEDAVFYYRVHGPTILIEFDHQGGIALETDGVTRDHVHSVTRTPNGNDYGKDLLRQHHERYVHTPDGRHVPRAAAEAHAGERR